MFFDRLARPAAPISPLLSVAAAVALALAGATVLGGCHGQSSAAPPATVATTVAVATTTTSTLPPTTIFQPSAPQRSQDDAATHMVDAWMAGDRAAASTDATPAAVAAVFAQPFPSGGIQARGCASAVAGPSSCSYRIFDDGSLLDLSAVMVTGGWMILSARFEA